MRARLHRYPRWRNIAEPLLDGFRCGSEAASVNYVSVLVERAVMAPDISKVDTDRHLDPGPSAWNFRNEVLRRVFHGNSLSPFRKACSSHFPLFLSLERCIVDLLSRMSLLAAKLTQVTHESN